MEHKISELKQNNKSFISFAKALAKINDPNKEFDYLAYIIVNFDKSIFGNNNIDSLIKDTYLKLHSVENYFDNSELLVIRKNLDYIKTHPYFFPKLIAINTFNDYYLRKYGKEVSYLYLTNQQRSLIAKNILQELEKSSFSLESIDTIKKKYGIKSNNTIFEMLHQVIYRDDLEALMISCGIKPYTEIFPMTKNKNYAFSWRIRNYIRQVLVTDDVDRIMNKMLEENNKDINYFRKQIYKLASFLLNEQDFHLFEGKVLPYFNKREIEQRKEKQLFNQTKKIEAQINLINKAILFVEHYIGDKQGVKEDELAENLAIIKKYDKEKYDNYIRKIYEEKAYNVIFAFLKSESESLSEFLFQENISFFTFNKYRLLIDDNLSIEIKNKLRKDCVIIYNNIKKTVDFLLNNVKEEYDFAYTSYILNKNFFSEKTIISFIENAIKKEEISELKYNKLKFIEKNLKYYMNNRLKYNQGTNLFNNSLLSLKEYKKVKFNDYLKTEAIKYLFNIGCDVNYFTVRSVLIRYAINKSFANDEEKII